MNTSIGIRAYHQAVCEVQPGTRLVACLSSPSQKAPFDRLWWFQALVEHCGLAGTFHGASNGGADVVLPLRVLSPGHLGALANWYTFRFRPIQSGDPAQIPALLIALARSLRKGARRITLDKVPDEDASASLLTQSFRAAGWRVLKDECDTNHVLHVEGRDFETYAQSLPGRLRTTLKRKRTKVTTQIHTRFDAQAWAAYEAIYAASWKGEEGSPQFLRAFAEAEGAAGRLRLGLAFDAAQPGSPAIAAQMWSVEGGCAFIHKLAHRESARDLSPGSILSAALFRHVLDTDKVALVDFGTGDDPYKRDWMNDVRPRYRLEFVAPGSPRNLPFLARRLAGSISRRIFERLYARPRQGADGHLAASGKRG